VEETITGLIDVLVDDTRLALTVEPVPDVEVVPLAMGEGGHKENGQEQLSSADIQLPDATAWQILHDLEQTILV